MSGIFSMSSAELHIFKNEIADGFIETVYKIAVGLIETVCNFVDDSN
jgi:hypothetical protein